MIGRTVAHKVTRPQSRILGRGWSYLWFHRSLYLMLVPVILFYVVFHYAPMYGATIAFRDFNPVKGIWDSPLVGWKYFEYLFSLDKFWEVFRNTLIINGYRILFGFPIPIIVSLFLNEVRQEFFKRTIQTAIYLPHFLSWVILGGLLLNLLSIDTGVINELLKAVGLPPVAFLTDEHWFRTTLVTSDIWKEFGWSTIIYLAALAGVNPQLYEAARIDGANRWQLIRHVTLPGIQSTIIILLVLRLGFIATTGFEQVFVLYSPPVYRVGEIIDTYVYRLGLVEGRFSLAAAVGLFTSVINFTFLVIANQVAKHFGGREQGIY